MNTLTSSEQSHHKDYYVPVCYERTCQYCGKEFIAHDKRKVFCSPKCRDIASKVKRGIKCNTSTEPYKRICVVCGKEFETFRDANVCCSHECSLKNHWQKSNRCRYEHTWDEYQSVVKEKARQRAEIKEIEKTWYRAIHTVERECKICGALFYCLDKERKCTCSSECSREYARRKRNCRNDARINESNLVDKDISLEKLFIRDDGTCYLCGKSCDWNDYEMRNGIKICGKTYPSIDHVVPLARGGKHQWENVRLAHWMCNVNKGDTTPTYTKEMSKEHARKMAIARSTNKKKTAQYTLDGKLIKIWDSTAQIERELGLNSKTIQNVCRRDKSKTGNTYGYHWEYVS